MRIYNKIFIFILSAILVSNYSFATTLQNNSLERLLLDVKNDEISDYYIKSNIYKKMSENEIESSKSLYEIFNLIKLSNFDDLDKYVNIEKDDIKDFKSKTSKYNNLNLLISNYFSNLNYTIVDSSIKNETISLIINCDCLNPIGLAFKIMPGFISKNLFSFIKGNNIFTDDNINLIINDINKIIFNKNLEKSNFQYELKFKKIDDVWKLYNINDIYKDLSKYVNENYEKIINFGK